MNYQEIRIGDKVRIINDPTSEGVVEKKVYTETVIENGAYDAVFDVFVRRNGAKNVSYRVDPNQLEIISEEDYSVFQRHNETSEQYAERQHEIRRKYHKKRVSETWEDYERRTGLSAPVIINRDELEVWADKTIKSICEFHYTEQSRQPYESVHDYRNRITRASNTRCSDVPPIH